VKSFFLFLFSAVVDSMLVLASKGIGGQEGVDDTDGLN
jgi:hypothetical protein